MTASPKPDVMVSQHLQQVFLLIFYIILHIFYSFCFTVHAFNFMGDLSAMSVVLLIFPHHFPLDTKFIFHLSRQL